MAKITQKRAIRIAEELKITYYWTKQCLETVKEKYKPCNGLDRLSKDA